jgi:hypothetical protein
VGKFQVCVKLTHLSAVFASTISCVKFYNFVDSLVVTADADTYIKANRRDNINLFARVGKRERASTTLHLLIIGRLKIWRRRE